MLRQLTILVTHKGLLMFVLHSFYMPAIVSADADNNAVKEQLEALQAQVTTLERLVSGLQAQLDIHSGNAAAHHERYADAEAVSAVGPHFSGDHADLTNVLASQHHVPVASELDDLLDGVNRFTDELGYDTLQFTGMNVQIVNGLGFTDSANGLGNLIIGYKESRDTLGQPMDCPDGFYCDRRTGSHMLVIWPWNNYTAYGGMVVGNRNETSGAWASVSAGGNNEASGSGSWVVGRYNIASGATATVSGGQFNIANGPSSSVSGGNQNVASGEAASISGGVVNIASGQYSSVSGGQLGKANGRRASVSGGHGNQASGDRSSVSGGIGHDAATAYCWEGDPFTDC